MVVPQAGKQALGVGASCLWLAEAWVQGLHRTRLTSPIPETGRKFDEAAEHERTVGGNDGLRKGVVENAWICDDHTTCGRGPSRSFQEDWSERHAQTGSDVVQSG